MVTVLVQVGKLFTDMAFAILYVHAAELFPTSVRASGVGLCVAVGKTGGVAAPYIVALVSEHFRCGFRIVWDLSPASMCVTAEGCLRPTSGFNLHPMEGCSNQRTPCFRGTTSPRFRCWCVERSDWWRDSLLSFCQKPGEQNLCKLLRTSSRSTEGECETVPCLNKEIFKQDNELRS